MSAPVVEIAICLDLNLLLPAVVLIRSIREHIAPGHRVRLHVLATFDVTELRDLVDADDDNFELAAVEVANVFERFPRNHYISQGTYLRFLLPDLLVDVPRLIYLDIDMIVRRDLDALFATELGEFGAAATSDMSLLEGSVFWDRFDIVSEGHALSFKDYVNATLALPNESGDDYLNAGLLVIDLDFWRRHDVAGRTLAFLETRPNLKFMDQDALSHVLQGRYARLDTRWNALANCAGPPDRRLKTRLSAAGRRWERVRTIWRTDPWIIHFAGANKPWDPKAPIAHGDIWWAYAQRSKAWPRLSPAHRRYRVLCQQAAEARPKPVLAGLLASARHRLGRG